MSETRKPSVLLVDGYSLIFRAFHALPLMVTKDGTYTNAVHGFFSMLLKALGDYRPEALCVMLDVHAPTFRHTLYPDYKGTRKPMPEELRPQLPLMREVLKAMHIASFEMEGYEADDLLGTAARLANEQGYAAYVLTGDRDSLQLAGGDTRIILTKTGISESLLLDAEGVKEHYGYRPDQVPDMKGLMGDSSDNIPGIAGIGEKTALKLISQYGSLDEVLAHADEVKGKLGEKLRAGRESALLSRDLGTIRRNAPIKPDFAHCTWQELNEGIPLLQQYELNQTAKSVERLLSGETVPAVQPRTTAAGQRAGGGKKETGKASPATAMAQETGLPGLQAVSGEKVFTDPDILCQAVAALAAEKPEFAVLHLGPEEVTLLTPSLELWRMPLLRDLMGGGMYEDHILTELRPVLEAVPLIVHGAKELFHLLERYHLPQPAIRQDTMLGAYLLHTAQKDYTLAASLEAEFAGEAVSLPESASAAEVYSMALRQRERLHQRDMESLLWDMEQPLTRVLFEMEDEGFLVDLDTLNQLSDLFTREIEESRQAVYRLTEVPDFNLNSPKQLGEVLFDKLGLPAQKKNKNGAYSTAAEVLEDLAPYHPCIEPLLRYRKLSKLQSTYVDGLRKLRGRDGRVHTTFDQTATVTGRISSMEPNLQNIPIRTAAEIHGVSMEDVTPEMRRAAKATNFGIVYGISGFGLARNAGISRPEANRFIERYFERYPGVRAFMDECVRLGYERGYAETMFHRRRELFELSSTNRNVRNFGERAAMNTPVQGTAADIIKLAMVQVERRLEAEGLKARLILQVHDELVVECPIEEAPRASALLQEVMENIVTLRVPLIAQVSQGKDWESAH